MKGQMKIGRRFIGILLTSAALVFAQLGVESNPAEPNQGMSHGNSMPQPPRIPVGPGTLNYLEGQVQLGGQPVSLRAIGTTNLSPGQSLTTEDGYVELLLTPGAFLRVGHNSEIQMVSAGLADTTVHLVKGSAMLEVDQLIKGTHLGLAVGDTSTQIQKKGLYIFDATQGSVGVLDGKATVVRGAQKQVVGKRDQVLLASDRPLKKSRLDEKSTENEPLYVWGKVRSQNESEANEAAVSNPGPYAVASTGWYWDPYAGYYGFWPADGFIYSPFGWGFYSPLYLGYGGYGWNSRSAWHGHTGWHGHPGSHTTTPGTWHRSGGASAFRSGGARGTSGFHGLTSGGFHAISGGGFRGGGSFHGGGGRR